MSGLKEKSAPKLVSPIRQEAAAISSAWEEARLVYPLYFSLAAQFRLEIPPAPNPNLPAACPASDAFERIMQWLGTLDGKIRPNQLRQLVHSLKDVKPEALRALTLRFLRRKEKTAADRDNIDLLLATYFALCAPEDLYSCEITLHDVAVVLENVIPDADPTELEWCAPLDAVLAALRKCEGLRDVFTARLLEKGRELKDAAGFMFYDPAALVAFTRFNFLMRRSFFRLLHADLRAIREGLSEIERRGIITVNCTSAGLSASEPLGHLREIALSWRQPLPKDYAEESANRTFEQLLAIRAAIERALGIQPVAAKLPEIPAANGPAKSRPDARGGEPAPRRTAAEERGGAATQPSLNPKPELRDAAPQEQSRKIASTPTAPAPAQKTSRPETVAPAQFAANIPPKNPTKASDFSAEAEETKAKIKVAQQSAPVNFANDLEMCLEKIWEQLIDAPPARGRSMSTVTLDGVRILLSAWEVAAFVSDGGQVSEDLRRAVAARASVMVARESLKKGGDAAWLSAAMGAGRKEMIYLQSRVDQAQSAKNTEAAVNLGISARRLLSAIEEAQS